ncbi:MAG: TonB-dependent receptor [Pseudomonadales bacterium]|nr:TonB-dependent receptor [Pseudomonadales bacterium]
MMKFLHRASAPILFASMAVSSLAITSNAAYADQTATHTLPDLMVSATRSTSLPASIAGSKILIDREQIEISGASNVAEVLSSVAGVQMQDLFGNGTNVSVGMRGFGDNASMNTLIMIDGRRLNNFLDIGSARLSGLSVDQIEAIEIISGSAGVLFGEGAVGGVINIITRQPSNESNVQLSLGNYENTRYRASFANQVGIWDYTVAAVKNKADNYRDHSANETTTVDFELGRTLTDGRVWFEFSGSDETQELAGGLFSAAFAANRKASRNNTDFLDGTYRTYRAGASVKLDEQWHLEVDLTKRFDDIKGSQIVGSNPSPTKQNRNQSSLNPRLIGRFSQPNGDLIVTAGVDYDDAGYFLSSVFGVQRGEQKTNSAYLQLLVPVTNVLELQTGVRSVKMSSDITDSFSFPTGVADDDTFHLISVGLDWKLSDDVKLFVRRAENARSAKIDEHTNSYTPSFAPVLLKHQYGVSLETGLHITMYRTTVDFSFYEIDLNDEIVYDGTVFSNINLDTTKRVGADLSILTQLNPAVSLNFQVSLVDATFDSGPYSDKEIPFVARQNISAVVNYQTHNAGSLHLQWLETGKRFAASDFNNEFTRMKSQNQLNATWKINVRQFSIDARINNVMNRKNLSFATVAYNSATFSNDVGYYAAPERNFLVTVSYQRQ